MIQILIYSGLLIIGIVSSQVIDLSQIRPGIEALTMICLAYIMIEVGLEFTMDKTKMRSYGVDYLVSASAAALPWLFCAAYFAFFLGTGWKESLLVGCFAAPTSAGVLFAMLAAAGLGMTWVFKKAQVLAIFDDLFTVLLLIPLKIMFIGFKPELFAVILIIILLLFMAYQFLHRLKWPVGKGWILLYGVGLVFVSSALEHSIHVHLEVLLPAFVLGCLLFNPHNPIRPSRHRHEHQFIEPNKGWVLWLDRAVKSTFMFLVGCSLPKIDLGHLNVWVVVGHVLVISLISNMGKCFPVFFYKQEASFRERLALCVAMFPRGEVGGGVLLIALSYGLSGLPATLAGLSLALNLILIGVFIILVKYLISKPVKELRLVKKFC